MHLTFKPFDGRRRNFLPIVDQDTGTEVGSIKSHGVGAAGYGHSGGIDISLFGGKYTMSVNRYEECWGFVTGVEIVLNHVTSTSDRDVQLVTAA